MQTRSFKLALLILPILVILSGCAVTNNFDEITRLQSYSENKDRQEAWVKAQDQRFEKVLTVAKGAGFNQYPNRRSILRNFGKPVYSRQVVKDSVSYEEWLYRPATKFFGADKVYFYFDVSGKLKKWEFTPSVAPAASSPS